MKKLPTDLQILDVIYRMYFDKYARFTNESPTRFTKNFVPIDHKKVAHNLGTEPDIVFARLYFHFEHKYGYRKDGADVHFFALKMGRSDKQLDTHCINFPYMAAVLADLRHSHTTARNNFIADSTL